VVTIVSPRDGADLSESKIAVEYKVRSASRPRTIAVQAFIDGRPTGEGQKYFTPVSPDDSGTTLQVAIPPHDATLSLVATSEVGAGEPAHIRLHWTGSREQPHVPTVYALVIGIAKYARPEIVLKFAAKDADDFEAELQKQQDRAYHKVIVRKL